MKITTERLKELRDFIAVHKDSKVEPIRNQTREYLSAFDELLAMREAAPVACQFYDQDNEVWCNFMNDKHQQNTIDAGYKVRWLYTAPPAPVVPDEKAGTPTAPQC